MMASISSYIELKNLIRTNVVDAEKEMEKALADPVNIFQKIISTNDQVEELVQGLPKFGSKIYFVQGQILERVQKNLNGAFQFYLKSAQMGFERGQASAGFCFLTGQGVVLNKLEAAHWLLEAAKQGNTRAQLNYGKMLEKGDGIKRDIDAASYWLQKAADQGDLAAQDKLQHLKLQFNTGEDKFFEGADFEKKLDYAQAFLSYLEAAKLEHIRAIYKLGIFYLQGKGTSPDKLKAYQYFKKGSDAGFLQAQYNLAIMHELGDGIPKDLNEAKKIYTQAAEKGMKQAQERLKNLNLHSDQPENNTSTYIGESRQFWEIQNNQSVLPKKEFFRLIKAGKQDIEKVVAYYEHHPVPGYEVGEVEIIYNPHMESAFASKLAMLEQRADNPSFKPNLDKERDPGFRAKTLKIFEKLSKPYKDPNFPHVKIFPAWHGTNTKITESIFKTGYANLATTDVGFYGKGIYSAFEAEYAYRVYSKGALILNYIATYSSFPVIDGDLPMLKEKGVYSNYDSHFIPVVPQNPNNPKETVYYPCKPGQTATYHEGVVFESAACLPRYKVTLVASIPKQLTSSPTQRDSKDKKGKNKGKD